MIITKLMQDKNIITDDCIKQVPLIRPDVKLFGLKNERNGLDG